MPKVIIAFDRDSKRIGTTLDVTDDEARTLIAEGRARLASNTGNAALRRPAGPTKKPPGPVIADAGFGPDTSTSDDPGPAKP